MHDMHKILIARKPLARSKRDRRRPPIRDDDDDDDRAQWLLGPRQTSFFCHRHSHTHTHTHIHLHIRAQKHILCNAHSKIFVYKYDPNLNARQLNINDIAQNALKARGGRRFRTSGVFLIIMKEFGTLYSYSGQFFLG